jgi:hypothetical protein
MRGNNGFPETWGPRGWQGGVHEKASPRDMGTGIRGIAFADGAVSIPGIGAGGSGDVMAVGAPLPSYKLFDSQAVFVAAFLGSPLAGGILMGINYKRLGKGGAAVGAIGIGVAITGLAVLVGNLMPGASSAAMAVIIAWATKALAQSMQGAVVEQHVRSGGTLASRWTAAGWGLAVLVVLAGVILAVVYGRASMTKVVIGTKDEIQISGASTKEDAKALGQVLQTSGYFKDRGVSVLLDRTKDAGTNASKPATTVSFVVKEGFWEKPEMVAGFEELGREAAPAVGGYPINVRLVNKEQDVKAEEIVGREAFGQKDEIFYMGSATATEADALGTALQSSGFFGKQGASVMLMKNLGVTTISFVVGEGIWDQADKVAAFETIVRAHAGTVGGLPINLRLMNANVEVKKEATVK